MCGSGHRSSQCLINKGFSRNFVSCSGLEQEIFYAENASKLHKTYQKIEVSFQRVLTYSVLPVNTGNPGGLNNMVIGIK